VRLCRVPYIKRKSSRILSLPPLCSLVRKEGARKTAEIALSYFIEIGGLCSVTEISLYTMVCLLRFFLLDAIKVCVDVAGSATRNKDCSTLAAQDIVEHC
jgi:hypothetical protein